MEEPDAIVPFAAIAGLIVGILGIILTKPLIILSTSIGGGMFMGLGMALVFQNIETGIFLGVVFAAAGIILQLILLLRVVWRYIWLPVWAAQPVQGAVWLHFRPRRLRSGFGGSFRHRFLQKRLLVLQKRRFPR